MNVPNGYRRASLILIPVLIVSLFAGAAEGIDLSRLVVIGDSLSAGFQNGSLVGFQQRHGYASLLAEQIGVDLPLPLIVAPGIPNVLTLVDPGPPPVIGMVPGSSEGRIDPLTQPLNLAVPGHTVEDALTARPNLPVDDLTDLILGLPGLLSGVSRSQVEWAEALAPTTVIIWLGSNDTLGAALEADASFVTPLADFEAAFTEVIDRMAATGASLVVANIPNVNVIPFLTSAEEVAALVGVPLSVIAAVLMIDSGDFVIPDAFPLIADILSGVTTGPLPDHVVLDADEVATIQAATDTFNTIIATQVTEKGGALVDLNAVTAAFDRQGLAIAGHHLTTGFLGGLFSLDGIHPTDTAYAAIANEFIAALNAHFGEDIPVVNGCEVLREDPLVPPSVIHLLRDQVDSFSLPGHDGEKLIHALEQAQDEFADCDSRHGQKKLRKFVKRIEKFRGDELTEEQAEVLLETVELIHED